MVPKRKLTEVVIARLSVYNRVLGELEEEGIDIVSSEELGVRAGGNAAQTRKDLSYFGEFGETGKGYYVKDLQDAISRILGVDKRWNVALVGVGHLGSALLSYPGFKESGFNIVAVFDNDLRKIGKRWEDITIQDISELQTTVKEKDIRIGIMTVPGTVAQEIADALVAGSIRAIVNFAPARINVPAGVEVRNADLSTELECLSYFLTNEAMVRTGDVKKQGPDKGA